MLLDLLVKATSPVTDTAITRWLRRIDRSMLRMQELDVRLQRAAGERCARARVRERGARAIALRRQR